MPDLLLRDTDRDDLIRDTASAVVDVIRPLIEQACQPMLVCGVEMSRLAGISPATLDRERRDGRVPSVKVGTRRLYRPDAVIGALMAANEEGAADD